MVIDITRKPLEVVAVFRSNTIKPVELPRQIVRLARVYTQPHPPWVLIETNNSPQVPEILWKEHEYPAIVYTLRDPYSREVIAGSTGTPGIRMNIKLKRIAAWNLKTLIEKDKLVINDEEIIEELKRYVEIKNGKAFGGDANTHDDLVSALLLTSWLVEQPFISDQINVRKNLIEEADDDEFLMDANAGDPVAIAASTNQQEFIEELMKRGYAAQHVPRDRVGAFEYA
jgi:hypothetical protein